MHSLFPLVFSTRLPNVHISLFICPSDAPEMLLKSGVVFTLFFQTP